MKTHKPKLILAMIVKNEARCIEKCLDAALPFVDEAVIADTGSTDDTVEIISRVASGQAKHVHLYHFEWTGSFSDARNFTLEQAERHGADWILVLDADEYLRKPDCDPTDFLQKLSEDKNAGAGYLTIYSDYLNADGSKETETALVTRLLPRGTRYSGSIHEQPKTTGKNILTPFVADHDGYLDQFKGERNLKYLIKELEKTPNDAYLLFQTGASLRSLQRTTEAAGYFERFYEQVKGDEEALRHVFVQDGIVRYLYTLMDLNTKASMEKALSIITETEKYFQNSSDFYFARGLFFMKLVLFDTARYIGYLPEIEKSYLTCLQIGERAGISSVRGTGSFKAYHNLSLYYRLTGDEKRAAECDEAEKRAMQK